MAKTYTICGIMSGTSRDGVDIAIVKISGSFPSNKIKTLYAETYPYPPWLKALLLTPLGDLSVEDVSGLDFLLGEFYAEYALRAIQSAGLKPDSVDAIGSHGQTLLHLPKGRALGERTVRSTLQVGSGAVLAQTSAIMTVSDFRSADIAAGGEGAPLVPVYDYALLRSSKKSRLALNIGGIANLTAIPKKARLEDIVAFDTGPGNCMIDTALRLRSGDASAFDRDGALARVGELDGECVEEVLAHPYFARKPPKTTGWEEFGEDYTRRLIEAMAGRGRSTRDMVRTFTEITGATIANAVEDFIRPEMDVDEVIVTGGGSHNSMLMGLLKKRLPEIPVDIGEAHGIDSDAKEACAFAYIAYLRLEGIAANIVSQAAGLQPALLGSISEPAASSRD
ncbi:anhydro-N-acetylmuramic acid kinase [Candidatus Eisenbacteria bacterium]|uniref:Anhydro-N-acetylmuramic acid kinase n=1 Tax=Eiseniibacteriota bacterium TaxID=2212470 RepID=A0ABV6YNF9_UNCEI